MFICYCDGFICLIVNEFEDIVEDEVLVRGVVGELEGLGVVYGVLFFIDLIGGLVVMSVMWGDSCLYWIYKEFVSDKDDDVIFVYGRLGIKGVDLVFDFFEGKRLWLEWVFCIY